MESIKIILPFPPSCNHLFPTIVRRGKPIRVKSKKYKEWQNNCPDLHYKTLDKVYTISYLIFFPDNRRRDGQNYMKAPLDYIVSEGVLEEDDRRFVCGEQWFDGGTDVDNPRIEITIKEKKDA